MAYFNTIGDTGHYKTVLTTQNRLLLAKVQRRWLQAYGTKYNRIKFNMTNSKCSGAIDLARVEKLEHGTQINVSAPKYYNRLLRDDLARADFTISSMHKSSMVFNAGGYNVGKATNRKKHG